MISVPTLVPPGCEELCRTGHFESRVVGNLIIACLPLEWKRKSCFTKGNSKEQNSGAGPASARSRMAEDRSWTLVLLYFSLGPGLCQELATYPRRGKLNPGRQDSFLPIENQKRYTALCSAEAFSCCCFQWMRKDTVHRIQWQGRGGMCPRHRQHQKITSLCCQKSTINNHPVNHFHSLSAQSTAKSTLQNAFCSKTFVLKYGCFIWGNIISVKMFGINVAIRYYFSSTENLGLRFPSLTCTVCRACFLVGSR